jgi:hypothetical protein
MTHPFPPLLADAKTMACLLDIGESTFHEKVRRGVLPSGYRVDGCVRWDPHEVAEVFKFGQSRKQQKQTEDPVMELIRAEEERRAR